MSREKENQDKSHRRMNSSFVGQRIKDGDAEFIVVDAFEAHRIEDGDLGTVLNQMNPIGAGSQGVVHAVLIRFMSDKNEIEERRCVFKKLNKQRQLVAPQSATSLDALDSEVAKSVSSYRKEPAFSAHANITQGSSTSTKHNIIKLIAVLEREGEEYAVLPYCDYFLDQLIADQQKQWHEVEASNTNRWPLFLSNPDAYAAIIVDVLSDILEAISHMYFERNYVHRDINPRNIGFYEGRWCLIDLDCAVSADKPVSEFKGSVLYMHPACFGNRNHTSHLGNDLYALGETLNDLLLREKRYDGLSLQEITDLKAKEYRDALFNSERLSQGNIDVSQLSTWAAICDIADKLCSPLYSHQPDILALITAVKTLKAREVDADVQSDVSTFRGGLKSDGCFSLLSSSINSDELLSSMNSRRFTQHLLTSVSSLFHEKSNVDSANTDFASDGELKSQNDKKNV